MTADPPPPTAPLAEGEDDADLAALFARTAADPPPFDAAAALAAARPSPARSPSRRNLLMKLSAATLAAAGLAGAALWLAPDRAEARAPTFQEVKAAVETALEESELMTATIHRPDADGDLVASERFLLAKRPTRVRLESFSGRLMQSNDHGAGRSLSVDPTRGFVSVSRLEKGSAVAWLLHSYDILSGRLHAQPTEVESDGRRLWRFDVTWRDHPRSADDPDATVPIRVWTDPETKLPVRQESGEGEGLVVLKDFQWTDAFDPRLFPTLPDAVEADLRRTVNQIPSQFASADLKAVYADAGPYVPFLTAPREPAAAAFGAAFGPDLTPGEGLGPLKLGMTPERVEAATGVPTFWTGPGEFWFYLPSRSVSARGTAAEGVVQIYVGAFPAPGFPGTVAGGVTAGMTAAEIERRLGPPDRTEEDPHAPWTTRTYADRRLWVESDEDAVVRASIWSPAADPVR